MATSSAAASMGSSLPSASLDPQRIQSLKTFLASDEPITIVPNFNYKKELDFLLTLPHPKPDEEDFMANNRSGSGAKSTRDMEAALILEIAKSNQKKGSNVIGPLLAGNDAVVPLWIALYLRRRNLCRLRCPSWMQVDHLRRVLNDERDANKDNFSTELPFRYAEISRAVLSAVGAGRSAVHAASGMEEEVAQAEVVRVLLEDIAGVRMSKIRTNIHAMSTGIMGGSLVRPMPVVSVSGIGSMEMAAIKPFLEASFEDHLTLVRAGVDKSGSGSSNGNGRASERASTARRVVSSSSRRRERRQAELDRQTNDNINDDDQDDDMMDDNNGDDVGNLDENSGADDMNNNNNNDELEEPRADDDDDDDDDIDNVNGTGEVSRRSVRRYRS
uniref:GINS subunit domain-containing protein n=1 Tax=Chaetoceros debilis TaxID=122233 RepID=A0A7S3VAL8_9STRA